MNFLKTSFVASATISGALIACAQTWTPLAHQPPREVGLSMLLTDGTVMAHQPSSNHWFRFSPDANGSYVNGTWSALPDMRSDYGPLYFASAVLGDGRVVVIGGEYNFGAAAWTNKGATFDPTTNSWTNLNPPSGSAWNSIGDAQCVVLPDGRFVIGNLFDSKLAALDPTTLTWSDVTATGKADRSNEESWALLPDGGVLTVNCFAYPGTQKWVPSMNTWINTGNTPQVLVDAGSAEIGPNVLMYDGRVLALGGTSHNAVWTPGNTVTAPGSWAAAPDFPNGLTMADAPACVMPNGRVLCSTAPGVFGGGVKFFEYNGTTFNPVPGNANSSGTTSYQGNMLLLPSGEMFFTDFTGTVHIYRSAGDPDDSWRPTVLDCPSVIGQGGKFVLQGTQLNGLTQGAFYGDDSSQFTNYPVVRLSYPNGHVTYCRTSGHSTMGVATGSNLAWTNVEVPKTAELGMASLEVIANGVASMPYPVQVSNLGAAPIIKTTTPIALGVNSGTQSLGLIGSGFTSDTRVTWTGLQSLTLTTSFVNAGRINVTVPASALTSLGSATLKAFNPSASAGYAINISPNVTETAISPTSTYANRSLRLSITGTGFDTSCSVIVNNAKMRAIYSSPTSVSVNIPPTSLPTPGTYPIKVMNKYGVETKSINLIVR